MYEWLVVVVPVANKNYTINRISGEANHTYITLSLASIGTQAATMVYAMAKKPKSPMFRG